MNNTKMNVLHINSYYQAGKFYKFLYDVEKKYCNIKVFIYTSNLQSNNDFDYGDYSVISKCYNKYDRLIFHLKHMKVYKDILKKIDVKKYDIIHAHSLFSNGYIAYKLKKKFNIKYIVAVRNTDVNVFFKKMFFLRNWGRKILNNADGIIFLSDSYKENVIAKYMNNNKKIMDKSYVIPNGIDNFWIENRKSKKLDKNRDINLIYTGRIEKNKNILTTARAAEILINKGYKVKLKMIGSISDNEYYNEIMKYDFVSWKDKLSKEDLIKEYRNSDIFVMPSIYETFGLSYAEAISQGLPVIYSKGQGFDNQFSEGEVGYHVTSLDPVDVSKKIEKVLKNYNDISTRCSEKCDKFNWEKIGKECVNLYEKLIEKD